MKKLVNIFTIKIFGIILLLVYSVCFAENLESPFNGLILDANKENKKFSFLLIGHAYGAPQNRSIYPAVSLLSNINLFNKNKVDFMVLLGDIIQHSNEFEIEALKSSFLLKLDFPVFNAPGNHDLANRQLYTQYFGPTFYSFQYASSFFIFLDSEIDDGKIKNDQMEFLMGNIRYCRKSKQIKNIFIFAHRLLWAIKNPPYSDILPFLNSKESYPLSATTISDTILPKLKSLSDKNVYFVSGDIGCQWSLPIFYEKDQDSNITYLATGIGDTERDAVLKVDVKESSEVTFTPISLKRKKLHPIEYYNIQYWKHYFNKNKESLIKKGLRVIRSKYFATGGS